MSAERRNSIGTAPVSVNNRYPVSANNSKRNLWRESQPDRSIDDRIHKQFSIQLKVGASSERPSSMPRDQTEPGSDWNTEISSNTHSSSSLITLAAKRVAARAPRPTEREKIRMSNDFLSTFSPRLVAESKTPGKTDGHRTYAWCEHPSATCVILETSCH